MSRFYGTIQGSRGQATRCGHHQMRATAASWNGCAMADTTIGPDDRDYAELRLGTWQGNGCRLWLYDGPVNPTDAEFFAGLIPGATPAWLDRISAALSERADAIRRAERDRAPVRGED